MALTTNRRNLIGGAAMLGGGLAIDSLMPSWARSATARMPMARRGLDILQGTDISLTIDRTHFTTGGREGRAITMNGVLPAPLIRLQEGQNVRFSVTNNLDEDSSIHWHGLLVPFQFDGVPGVSFPGIRPRETFVYEFPIRQSGTYWYHSHSGVQEQMGHYGPIVIDPAGADPVSYDSEYVLVLSDWSPLGAETIFRKLKQDAGYFNYQRQTLAGLIGDPDSMPLDERLRWGRMRMSPTDISDVTGATYTYLINGHGPQENWTMLFNPGERVRLRIINACTMTFMNVRLPGLEMEVVQVDGQNVKPVVTDEFQMGVAETYDVIVTPREDRAYAFVAEAIDRSGMTRATLAPRAGMTAEMPALRERPTLTMRDMGMAGMGAVGSSSGDMTGMDHASTGTGTATTGEMDMSMRNPDNAPPDMEVGPGVAMIAPMPQDRMGDPGLGLENVPHRVLVYRDLEALEPHHAPPPTREMEIHLTSNMERYMWSFDGEKFSDLSSGPIRFAYDERVRVTLVNDTMMAHPIHMHGHFFELVNGKEGSRQPLKHTVNVLPGGTATFDLTANEPGDWAFHCHLLYHMEAGMFQVVTVRPFPDGHAVRAIGDVE